jgi:hypothetical protein
MVRKIFPNPGALLGKIVSSNRFARLPGLLVTVLPKLNGSELRTLIALGLFVDPNYRCWPSLTRLSQLTGLHRRHVHRSLQKLIGMGVIRRIAVGGGAVSNTYEIVHSDGVGTVASGPDTASPNGRASVDHRAGGTPSVGSHGTTDGAPGAPPTVLEQIQQTKNHQQPPAESDHAAAAPTAFHSPELKINNTPAPAGIRPEQWAAALAEVNRRMQADIRIKNPIGLAIHLARTGWDKPPAIPADRRKMRNKAIKDACASHLLGFIEKHRLPATFHPFRPATHRNVPTELVREILGQWRRIAASIETDA